MDYNVPGGKLNRGLSVVDSVAILKGRELTESEYFKAAVLGWAVEWVCLQSLSPPFLPRRGLICDTPLKAPSLLPRFGRYHGLEHHPSRPGLLVPRRGRRSHGRERCAHSRGRDLPDASQALSQGALLRRLGRSYARSTSMIHFFSETAS